MINIDFLQTGLQNGLFFIVSFLLFPPQDNELFNFIKFIFIFFDFLFLIIIIYFLSTTSFLKWLFLQDLFEFFSYRPLTNKKINEKWKTINLRLASDLEGDHKLAILEVTKIFNDALELMGYRGETLEEKINQIPEEIIENKNELKGALRVYKNIIEDPSYKLKKETAKYIILTYEKIFKNLNLI